MNKFLLPRIAIKQVSSTVAALTFSAVLMAAPTTAQETAPGADQELTAAHSNLAQRNRAAHDCVAAASPLEPPTQSQRTIDVDDWQVSFSIPENYQTVNHEGQIEVLDPNGYEMMECLSTCQPGHGIRPYRISISLVNKTLTEADIRSQITRGQGVYWGTTATPNGNAFMHTTSTTTDLVHLSLPLPNEATTIVITADTDSTGGIIQEDVFETIIQTFQVDS